MFQPAEHEQTVTTIARLKKIDLNLHDLEAEAEELVADRVVAHVLKKQNDEKHTCANDPGKFLATGKKRNPDVDRSE